MTDWRLVTKLVAIIDTVLVGLCCLAVIFVTYRYGVGAQREYLVTEHSMGTFGRNHPTVVTIVAWIKILAPFAFLAMGMWAAILLLCATAKHASPTKSITKAKVWISVNAAWVLYLAYLHISRGTYSTFVGILAVRSVMCLVICQFISKQNQTGDFSQDNKETEMINQILKTNSAFDRSGHTIIEGKAGWI